MLGMRLFLNLFGNVERERLFQEWEEARKCLATEHVAIALNSDLVHFLVQVEARVIVAPALLVDVVELRAAIGMIINDLGNRLVADFDGLSRHKLIGRLELSIYLFKPIHRYYRV